MGISHRYPYIVLMPQFVLSPIITRKQTWEKILIMNKVTNNCLIYPISIKSFTASIRMILKSFWLNK